MSKLGIDVSDHNGLIDWEKVKESGVEFAVLRIGYGSDMESQDDGQIIRNMRECDRLGIPYSLYIYSYALNDASSHSESRHMIRIAKQGNANGYLFDMEDADGYKAKHGLNPRQHKEELTNFCLNFMEDMRNAGYDNVGVYANHDYFKNILDYEKLKSVGKIWLAHWGINKPSLECDIWQYTSDGTVPGINGRVDMNIGYFDLPNVKPSKPTTRNENIYNFQKAANVDKYTDMNGNYLVEDGIYGAKTESVQRKILLNHKKVSPLIIQSSCGAVVEWVQTRCNEILERNLEVNGEYDSKTKDAVKEVQKKLGLDVDGIVGYNTVQALFYN